MNNLIIYSIEITVSLALFYTAYWLFLRNETFFKLNRFYLVSSVVISLTMPLLNISMTNMGEDSLITRYLILPIEQYERGIVGNMDNGNFPMQHENPITGRNPKEAIKDNPAVNAKSGSEQIAPVNPAESDSSAQKINWFTVIQVIYFAGAALLFIRFAANLFSIFGYVRRSKPQQMAGARVVRFDKNISPFSFLNLIFISNRDYPEAELDKIIFHENVHIRQKHSLDLILLELLLIFQWFNPFVWFYKRAIKITHEYLADHGTLSSGVDPSNYQHSLLNEVLLENNLEIASNYNLSIKKRIAMMLKKRSSRLSALKLVIALPILIFLFSAFAFSTNHAVNAAPEKGNGSAFNKDSSIKRVDVPASYLSLIAGEYVSTGGKPERRIVFSELLGTLFGWDNGYTYKIIPVGGEKFINPDDRATLEFNTKDKNTISLLLFGKITLNKVKIAKGSGDVHNRSMAFTLANLMLKDGIEPALSYYKAIKDSSNYFLTEIDMSYAGFELMNNGKTKEAVALLKLDTELFGASFNAYDSYAEALLASGDKTKAIENFKESIRLNPGSRNGLKKLKELGVNTDELVKPVKISLEDLKLLEGTYLSTDQPNWVRKITLKVADGELTGEDNGYNYKLIPMGNGKFINPDDGVSLVFDTKDKNAISFLIFGTVTMKKVNPTKEPGASLKEYAGVYLPLKKNTGLELSPMEIVTNGNRLFRYIETEPKAENRTIDLQFVTDNIFYYTDKSGRSIEFIVNYKKQVTGCILRRWDGVYNFTKKN